MRTWIAALITAVVALAACTSDPDPEPARAAPTPTPATYTVAPEDCPLDPNTGEAWLPLTVQTTDAAEAPFLDDISACMAPSQDRTWLRNASTAAWTISLPSGGTTVVNPASDTTVQQQSFTDALSLGSATLLPGADVVVEAPPLEVEWLIDLRLSIAWEGHEVLLEELESMGQDVVVAALTVRESPARKALVQCTVSVANLASESPDLETVDPVALITTGLTTATTAAVCRDASLRVAPPGNAQAQLTLANDLARLNAQTASLQRAKTNISYAQRLVRVLMLIPRV